MPLRKKEYIHEQNETTASSIPRAARVAALFSGVPRRVASPGPISHLTQPSGPAPAPGLDLHLDLRAPHLEEWFASAAASFLFLPGAAAVSGAAALPPGTLTARSARHSTTGQTNTTDLGPGLVNAHSYLEAASSVHQPGSRARANRRRQPRGLLQPLPSSSHRAQSRPGQPRAPEPRQPGRSLASPPMSHANAPARAAPDGARDAPAEFLPSAHFRFRALRRHKMRSELGSPTNQSSPCAAANQPREFLVHFTPPFCFLRRARGGAGATFWPAPPTAFLRYLRTCTPPQYGSPEVHLPSLPPHLLRPRRRKRKQASRPRKKLGGKLPPSRSPASPPLPSPLPPAAVRAVQARRTPSSPPLPPPKSCPFLSPSPTFLSLPFPLTSFCPPNIIAFNSRTCQIIQLTPSEPPLRHVQPEEKERGGGGGARLPPERRGVRGRVSLRLPPLLRPALHSRLRRRSACDSRDGHARLQLQMLRPDARPAPSASARARATRRWRRALAAARRRRHHQRHRRQSIHPLSILPSPLPSQLPSWLNEHNADRRTKTDTRTRTRRMAKTSSRMTTSTTSPRRLPRWPRTAFLVSSAEPPFFFLFGRRPDGTLAPAVRGEFFISFPSLHRALVLRSARL